MDSLELGRGERPRDPSCEILRVCCRQNGPWSITCASGSDPIIWLTVQENARAGRYDFMDMQGRILLPRLSKEGSLLPQHAQVLRAC